MPGFKLKIMKFLSSDVEISNTSKHVNTNILQGLNPSTKAIKNVKIGSGILYPASFKISGETFFATRKLAGAYQG